MREILYRAKRLADGKWIYGYYFEQDMPDGRRSYIRTTQTDRFGTDFSVDPATVGQYTGHTDIDGDKIFEGDVISVLVFQPRGEYLPREVVIEWNEERASYIGVNIKDAEESWGVHWLKKSLIVGNRWNYLELLKGGENGKETD